LYTFALLFVTYTSLPFDKVNQRLQQRISTTLLPTSQSLVKHTTLHNPTTRQYYYHSTSTPITVNTFEMLANGLTFLTALLPLLSVADAAHTAPRHHRRHHGLAARDEPHPRGIAQVAPRANAGHSEAKRTIKRAVKKRGAQQQCRIRGSAPPTAASSAAASAVSSVAADSAVPSPAAPSSAAAAETPSIPNQNAWADQVSLLRTFFQWSFAYSSPPNHPLLLLLPPPPHPHHLGQPPPPPLRNHPVVALLVESSPSPMGKSFNT